MKKLLLLLLICPLFIACSDNDDKGDRYLTSLENGKSGIVGTWKSTTGGIDYTVYYSDGSTCNGLYQNSDWDTCTKYEILKSGSDYVIYKYYVGSETLYTSWKITRLDENTLTINEIGESSRTITRTRVK